jgi:hypothetical protein
MSATYLPPTLALNFTTASLDPRVSFTRALATATRVNSSGFIEVVSADAPRFDYDPISKVCKGLLIEEQRSNILTFSDSLALTGWAGANSTRLATTVLYPAGLSGGSSLTDTATNDRHIAFKIFTSAAATYCQSMYFAKGTLRYVQIQLAGPVTSYGVIADLETGVITDTNSVGVVVGQFHGIEDAGNGFWRVWCGHTITAGTSYAIVATSNSATPAYSASGNPTYAGTGQLLYAYGAQVEVGTFPTSYIPTAATGLTRNADVATISGSNFTSFWGATQGGAQVQAISSTVSGIRPLVQFDDNTANEIIALRGNTTNPELYIVDDGTPQAQLDAGTIAANTAYSLTGWWATNDCKARQDSGAVVTDTTATIPTVTQARIGSDGTNYLNGTIATIGYYDSFFGRPIYTRRKNKVFASLL